MGLYEGLALELKDQVIAELKQAMAEKDAQLAKAAEEIAYLNMRVDALRRWLNKKISTSEAKDAAYQQLMEKAVLFATWLKQAMDNEADEAQDADTFIKSPEVQAWKEVKL